MEIPYSRQNEIYKGADQRGSLFDLYIPEEWNMKLIIFIHGYMGYKDWGCWNLVQEYFLGYKFGFLKYNVSHNGGTVENPIDFDDLEAFSRNTYYKEILDFEAILDVVEERFDKMPHIYLIGHSRGGGIALLQSDNGLVNKIASWAGISNIESRFPKGKELEAWREDGFYFRKNGRTHQTMPHHYSQYESFIQNRSRLDIEKYCRTSITPTCIIHGDKDESVSIKEGEALAKWLQTDLIVIKDAQHTFGSSQPWKEEEMPAQLKEVCEDTLDFFYQPKEKNAPIEKVKLSLLADLIKMAQVDHEVDEAEVQFLLAIATQLGVTKKEFVKLFSQNIEFNPPKFEMDRIMQFHRLVLLMNVDMEIDESEINLIRDLGILMGLNPNATEEVLSIMHEFPHGAVPPHILLDIFRTFHS